MTELIEKNSTGEVFLVPAGHAARGASRLTALDGFRALAILCVLSFHYTVRWAYPRDPAMHLSAGAIFNGFTPLQYGGQGVELFFVISGFVILMTLERCRNVADFAVRRFARLWPPLFVAATITTIVMAVIGPPDWMASGFDYATSTLIFSPAVMSRLLHHPGIKWVDGVYWSLFVEVRFYAWAALIYLLARKNFVVLWLVWLAAMYAAIAISLKLHLHAIHSLLSLAGFPAYAPYFTIGICVYEIHSAGRWKRLAMGGVAAGALLVLYSAARSANIFAGHDPVISVTVTLVILALFLLFLIDHPVLGVFKWGPVVMLGQASYSLYLLHQNIGVAAMRWLIGHGIPYLAVLPLMPCVMVAASLVLFRYVEVPAKNWILRQTKQPVAAVERRAPWLSYVSGKAVAG